MTYEQVPEKFRWTNLGHQYVATLAGIPIETSSVVLMINCTLFGPISVSVLALSLGTEIGWTAPALPILISEEDSPLLSGPLSNEQISWIGSIDCLGAIVGALSFGFFTTQLGAKRVLLFITAPIFIVYWTLTFFGNMYYHILLARFLAGFAGGGAESAVILYISEIANDDVRGRLGSSLVVFLNIGTEIVFVLGASVQYKMVSCICIFIPIAFIVVFAMIPNTPQFYLQRGHTQKAEDALKFYKGYQGNNDHAEDIAIRDEFERLKTIASERKKDEKFQLADFCNRGAVKGLAIGILLVSFSQLTACYTIINYAVMIFAKVGTDVDPYISSILCAIALIFGSLTTTYLADRLGRKKLNLISMMGSAFGLLATALYYYLNLIGYDLTAFAWVPVTCLSIVVYVSSAGIIPLAFICSVEYLPAKIRTYGMAIICGVLSLAVFISVKTFPILLESIDLHGCLMIFGFGSVIGFFFVLFVLEETSGKSLDEIVDVGKDNEQKSETERV